MVNNQNLTNNNLDTNAASVTEGKSLVFTESSNNAAPSSLGVVAHFAARIVAEATRVQAECGNTLPTFALFREGLQRIEQQHFAETQRVFGDTSLEAVSAALSAKDRTGRGHLAHWKNTDMGEPAGGVRYAAELLLNIVEMWHTSPPTFGNTVSIASTHLLLDAVATAAQTLRIELAQVEAQTMSEAAKGVQL